MSETPDVTSTLAELERKLRELEQELSSIGRRGAEPPAGLATEPPAGLATEQPATLATERPAGLATEPQETILETAGRLIDERSEHVEPPPVELGVERPSGPSDAQLASLADLRRFRDRLERFAKELTEDYDALLGRVMSSLSARSPQPAQDLPGPTPARPGAIAPTPSAAPPATEPEPSPPVPSPHEETLFEGRVELGVGPFYDISSLGAFERQLGELPYVIEASVRRFEASHAVIDLRLAAPVALVGELRRVLDSDFGVRQVAGGRILLTFDEL